MILSSPDTVACISKPPLPRLSVCLPPDVLLVGMSQSGVQVDHVLEGRPR